MPVGSISVEHPLHMQTVVCATSIPTRGEWARFTKDHTTTAIRIHTRGPRINKTVRGLSSILSFIESMLAPMLCIHHLTDECGSFCNFCASLSIAWGAQGMMVLTAGDKLSCLTRRTMMVLQLSATLVRVRCTTAASYIDCCSGVLCSISCCSRTHGSSADTTARTAAQRQQVHRAHGWDTFIHPNISNCHQRRIYSRKMQSRPTS